MNPPITSDFSASPGSSLRAWLAVLSVALGAFVVVTSEFLPIGLLTDIANGLGVSDGTAGLMISIPGIVAAIAAPVMTTVAGKIDRRILVLSLISLLVVSNVTAALAQNFPVMIVARVLFGITLGGFWTIAVTLGGRLVSKQHMARATTIILAGISTATVAGVPTGKMIADLAGWRIAFGVIAGIAVIVGVVQMFVLPRLPAPPAPGARQLTALLHHSDARLGLMTVAVVIAGHFAAYTYVKPFLKDSHVSESFLSAMFLAYGVAGIVGNFAGGAAAAKNLRITVTTVIALLAGSIALLPFVKQSSVGIATLIVTWGLAFGAIPIALQLWVFKAAPEAMEGGAAMLVSTFQVFIALGSVLGGVVVDNYGTSVVMWASGAVSMLGLFVVSLSRHVPQPVPVEGQVHLA